MQLYKANNLPEIIFTVNDRVAFGVYKAAREVGINIPENIGILGFGFNDTAQTFSPSLSIINQDPRKIGSIASELLIEIIKNPDKDIFHEKILEEEFLWNDSIIRKSKSNNLITGII